MKYFIIFHFRFKILIDAKGLNLPKITEIKKNIIFMNFINFQVQ